MEGIILAIGVTFLALSMSAGIAIFVFAVIILVWNALSKIAETLWGR